MDAEDRDRLLEKLRRRRLSSVPTGLDMGKAILDALRSARLSGVNSDFLEKMAEDEEVPRRVPEK